MSDQDRNYLEENDGFLENTFIDEDRLGEPTLVDGKFVWDPPSDLDPAVVEAVQESVKALNRSLEEGENRVTRTGGVE